MQLIYVKFYEKYNLHWFLLAFLKSPLAFYALKWYFWCSDFDAKVNQQQIVLIKRKFFLYAFVQLWPLIPYTAFVVTFIGQKNENTK